MSGSKSSVRQPFRPIYPLDGICKTRILLAVAGRSLGDASLGNWSMAPATDADPVRKHRQPRVHLENLPAGQRMAPGLTICGRSRPDGVGSRLPQSDCPGTARGSDAHGFGLLVGYLPLHVWTRHGPQPVGPRRANYPEIHLSEAAPGPLRPDRLYLDQRGVVLYDQ